MTEYRFGGFRFEVASLQQANPGGPGRVQVLVFQGGEPFLDLHGQQMRKLFPATAKPERIAQFCERFATDDAFRTGTLLKHAFSCC